MPVPLLADLEQAGGVAMGQVALLENIRFFTGEKSDADELAQRMAAICDVFVMDAFGTAHRAQASTHGVAKFAPRYAQGFFWMRSFEPFSRHSHNLFAPWWPLLAVQKFPPKLEVLGSLATSLIALLLVAVLRIRLLPRLAMVWVVRSSKRIGGYRSRIAEQVDIPIPVDVMVAGKVAPDAVGVVKAIDAVADDEMILDIGPVTARAWAESLIDAQTIMWNGPVGVFEFPQFGQGTKVLGEAIAASSAYSIAGGGDTLAAVEQFDLAKGIFTSQQVVGHFLNWSRAKSCQRSRYWAIAAQSETLISRAQLN